MQACPLACRLSLAAFALQQQSGLAVTETIWGALTASHRFSLPLAHYRSHRGSHNSILPHGPQSLKCFLAFYGKDLPKQVKKKKALRNVSKGEGTRLANLLKRRGKVRGGVSGDLVDRWW